MSDTCRSCHNVLDLKLYREMINDGFPPIMAVKMIYERRNLGPVKYCCRFEYMNRK